MWTASKVVAALAFAAVAWYASQLIIPLFPEGSYIGLFAEVNALLALPVGWKVAGSRAGWGWGAAVSYGLTTIVAVVVWCLFLQSFGVMIRQSLKNRYDGPVEAVVNVFELMIENAMIMADIRVIVTLVVGGILAGLLTEFTSRHAR